MDDIWNSEEPNPGGQESMEVKKLRKVHHSRGYVDGISSAKEENLQNGFDDAFPVGAELGFAIGEIIGRLQVLNCLYGSENPELREKFKLAKQELRINNLLSKRNFDENFDHLPSLEDILGKWKAIVENFDLEFSK